MAKKAHLGRGLSALIPTDPVTENRVETESDANTRPADIFFGGHGHSPKGGSVKELLEPRKDVSRETSKASRKIEGSKSRKSVSANKAQKPEAKRSTGTSDVSRETSLVPVPGAKLELIKVSKITPNRSQPRQTFDEDEIAELAASIKEVGLLQPIVVRTDPTDKNAYELIMGERRLRACQLAKVTQIPAIVRETNDNKMLLDALIENLHRVQLNPLEEAANALRLLRLPASVQPKVAAGVLSAGHARALLAVTDPRDQEYLAERIIAEGLSVRSTEEIVALGNVRGASVRKSKGGKRREIVLSPTQAATQERWTEILDTRVSLKPGKTISKLVIEYADEADLQRLTQLLEQASK